MCHMVFVPNKDLVQVLCWQRIQVKLLEADSKGSDETARMYKLHWVHIIRYIFPSWDSRKAAFSFENNSWENHNYPIHQNVITNKRTMMVLYRSPEQTALHTYS